MNIEAHKRKFYPNKGLFGTYTTMKEGQWVLMNNQGDLIYSFKSEEEKNNSAQSICDSLMNIYWKLEREYLQHKMDFPQYYEPTYEEASWLQRALYRGFKYRYKSDGNWWGCSLTHPMNVLERDNKRIILSLQSAGIPDRIWEKHYELAKARAVRYIGFYISDQDTLEPEYCIYEDGTGELPSMEFIEEFIK